MKKKFNEDEKIYLKKVGILLKKYRNSKKLTQSQLAEKINIKPLDISRYENGKKDISLLTLNKFCKFYNINMYKFIYNMEGIPKTDFKKEIDDIREQINKISKKLNNLNYD